MLTSLFKVDPLTIVAEFDDSKASSSAGAVALAKDADGEFQLRLDADLLSELINLPIYLESF